MDKSRDSIANWVEVYGWTEGPGDLFVRTNIATGDLYDVHGAFHVVATESGPKIRDVALSFYETEE